jgi:hypothetical protein
LPLGIGRTIRPFRAMKASPVVLAETYCANWIRHGTCVGTDINLKTGRQSRWRPEGSPCLVSEGKRCPYLEASVLPMAGWKWKSSLEGTAFQNAVHHCRIQIVKEKTSSLSFANVLIAKRIRSGLGNASVVSVRPSAKRQLKQLQSGNGGKNSLVSKS